MPIMTPEFEAIRDKYLADILNMQPDADVGEDSDHYVRASAIAACVEGLYSHQTWVWRQAFADLADDDIMEKIANQRGLTLKPASFASGLAQFIGVAGTNIPVGTQFTVNQQSYATTVATPVGADGTVQIESQAIVAGAAGNISIASPGALSAAPDGVNGVSVASMTGGSDSESYDELRSRLLDLLSELPRGGNAADYRRWALAVPGVSRALVFPLRRGAGTVDVVPMPSAGLPSATLVAAVQAAIDAVRPVGMLNGAGAVALIPTAVPVGVSAALSIASGAVATTVVAQVETAIGALFSSLGPGDTLIRNALISAILGVPGVIDVILASPVANVTATVDINNLQIITLGVLSVTS